MSSDDDFGERMQEGEKMVDERELCRLEETT